MANNTLLVLLCPSCPFSCMSVMSWTHCGLNITVYIYYIVILLHCVTEKKLFFLRQSCGSTAIDPKLTSVPLFTVRRCITHMTHTRCINSVDNNSGMCYNRYSTREAFRIFFLPTAHVIERKSDILYISAASKSVSQLHEINKTLCPCCI